MSYILVPRPTPDFLDPLLLDICPITNSLTPLKVTNCVTVSRNFYMGRLGRLWCVQPSSIFSYNQTMQRCSVSAFILFQKMANSPGFLFTVDKNCNGEETRRTVQKLKRKLTSIHVTQKSAAKPEKNTATPVKRKRMCKNYVEETVLENKSEDRSCDTVDLQDNILEREMQKKWKGSRSKRKLN